MQSEHHRPKPTLEELFRLGDYTEFDEEADGTIIGELTLYRDGRAVVVEVKHHPDGSLSMDPTWMLRLSRAR